MIYVAGPFQSWKEWKQVISEFLLTEQEFLLFQENENLPKGLLDTPDTDLPDLDLIQFCSLKLFERGELGIREIHWRFSEFVTGCNTVNSTLQFLSRFRFKPVIKVAERLKLMRIRRKGLQALLKGFANYGILIPHYIEPQRSTILVSKTFARSLIEINSNGDLSLNRACFALARTANFKCVRISAFSK